MNKFFASLSESVLNSVSNLFVKVAVNGESRFANNLLNNYQYAIGLVEDYLDGGCDDAEFVAEYDEFLKRKDLIGRWLIKFHEMKEVRNGKYKRDYDE